VKLFQFVALKHFATFLVICEKKNLIFILCVFGVLGVATKLRAKVGMNLSL